MTDVLTLSERNRERAWNVIRETGVVEIWESFGARPHLVGSLKTGLLMDTLDIDFHIYSDRFSLVDSFAAVAALAENDRIKRVEYFNLLDTEERCVEWHAWYREPDGDLWQIDMIHILKESKFAGYFEEVAKRIRDALTPETKLAIVTIKHGLPPERETMSIEIYKAVLADGVRSVSEVSEWKAAHPGRGIVDWMP